MANPSQKTLLVTGGGSGIGAAIAKAADTAGYRVGVIDINLDAACTVAEQLTNAVPLAADVCDANAVADAVKRLGSVHVAVNNAGILRTGPLLDHSVADFRQVIDLNLTATFIVAQAVAKNMQSHGGSIINIASINGVHPSPNSGAYGTAKAGVILLTQHMAIEWGELGIRVNAVAPGFVDTGMSTPFYANPTVRAARAGAVPLGRLGEAQDIANAVIYLASDAASYISGHTLTVDGGVGNSLLQQLPRT